MYYLLSDIWNRLPPNEISQFVYEFNELIFFFCFLNCALESFLICHFIVLHICDIIIIQFILCVSSVRLWALTGQVLMEMVGHTAIVYSVDYHASGLVVSGSEDRFAKIWKGDCFCCLCFSCNMLLCFVVLLCAIIVI